MRTSFAGLGGSTVSLNKFCDSMLKCSVLIQPNLRFFHELFGWEVELARQEQQELESQRENIMINGIPDASAMSIQEVGGRRIYYSWPSFCRDLVSACLCLALRMLTLQHCLNRRFLCN